MQDGKSKPDGGLQYQCLPRENLVVEQHQISTACQWNVAEGLFLPDVRLLESKQNDKDYEHQIVYDSVMLAAFDKNCDVAKSVYLSEKWHSRYEYVRLAIETSKLVLYVTFTEIPCTSRMDSYMKFQTAVW